MILVGFLNHFTFCKVVTTIMYVISVDNVKNANSPYTTNNFILLGSLNGL